MSTNRPFFANFLFAFRAHSALQNIATSPPSAGPSTSSPSSFSHSPSSTASQSASNARSIGAKASALPIAGAVQAAGQLAASAKQSSTSGYPRAAVSPPSAGFPIPGSQSRQRRGSDSSNEGFRDIVGKGKWYIGGRTATGEEKFYKLGMVKRYKSADRLSIDRLSL